MTTFSCERKRVCCTIKLLVLSAVTPPPPPTPPSHLCPSPWFVHPNNSAAKHRIDISLSQDKKPNDVARCPVLSPTNLVNSIFLETSDQEMLWVVENATPTPFTWYASLQEAYLLLNLVQDEREVGLQVAHRHRPQGQAGRPLELVGLGRQGGGEGLLQGGEAGQVGGAPDLPHAQQGQVLGRGRPLLCLQGVQGPGSERLAEAMIRWTRGC